MKKILIVGCGDVGTELARLVSLESHEVFGVRRSIPDTAPYQALSIDVFDKTAVARLDGDFDVVVYCVAADTRSEDSYKRAYVEGVANTLAHFESTRRRPLYIFVSSTGVYGQRNGEWVDEESSCDPEHFTGAFVRDGERLVEKSSLPSIIVRFGGIYGPKRLRLLDLVRSGQAKRVTNVERYTNRIHRDDCARMLQFLIDLENPKPIYNGVDTEPSDASLVYAWLAEALGLPVPEAEEWAQERIVSSGLGKRCRSQLIQDEGFVFRFPSFREGYREVISSIEPTT